MKQESIDKLKKTVVSTYQKFGYDTACVIRGGRSYTGHEIANEIESETEFGLSFLENLLNLTAELVKRDKINVHNKDIEKRYDPYVKRYVTLNQYIAECYGGLPNEFMLEEQWLKLPKVKSDKIFKRVWYHYNEKNGHLIILSKEKPKNGEWGFDYRPDENGKLHAVCYVKQEELTMFNTMTERKIIASTSLNMDKDVLNIKPEQVELFKAHLDHNNGYEELYIEYEEYPVESFGMTDGEPTIDERIVVVDGYCNLHSNKWE